MGAELPAAVLGADMANDENVPSVGWGAEVSSDVGVSPMDANLSSGGDSSLR